MSWEDQGRQYHGWFGDGKAPPRDADEHADALFDPENVMARIDAIGYAAVASLPVADRRRDSAIFDDQRLDDLRRVMASWMGARALTPAAFAARFADPPASDAAIEALRAATEGARTATTHADLAHASVALAAGMQAIGLAKWPRFLRDAAEQAAANGKIVLAQATPPTTATDATPAVTPAPSAPAAPPGRYVSSTPRAWIGHPPVGTGECVPLVRAATGAPLAAEWRRGAPVQGNTAIRPGTAIATFDSNGHYDGHAAIYLGQDAYGIQVIDQWNIRNPAGNITGQQPPHERTLYLGNSHHNWINRGESYYVVK